MKNISKVIFGVFLLISIHAVSQTTDNRAIGPVGEVKPYFAGQHSIMVNKIELILLTDMSDATGNSFQINSEFKDLLVKQGDEFILNPKYKGKQLQFTYTINGKGWKCISHVEEIKVKIKKAKSTSKSNTLK